MDVDRRAFLRAAGLAGAALTGDLARARPVRAQAEAPATRLVQTPTLTIGTKIAAGHKGSP